MRKFIKSAPAEETQISEPVVEQSNETPDESVKAGRRNNKSDQDMIQQVHDHSCKLGASCDMHNTGTTPLRAPTKPTTKAVEGKEPSDQAEALGMPLDSLVEAVRTAFWDIRDKVRLAQKPFDKDENEYWDWDSNEVPYCVAVYDGFVIARVKLQHYRVEFVIEDGEIKLQPQGEWQEVTQSWISKSIPAEFLKAYEFKRDVGAVKSLGGNRLGNYLIVWGDKDRRDLTGEWFTKSTEGLTAIFDTIGKVPALYHHGMDGAVKYTPIGVIDTMIIDDIGLWTETQLDMANKYAQEVQKLARKRALGASSGTLPAARKVAPSGEITAWPIIEGSFTPTPAEPRLREFGVAEVKAIYEQVGLELPTDVESNKSEGTEEVRSTDDIEIERERLRLFELSI